MLDALTVDELSANCREQTARYMRSEPSQDEFCLELFRRAVVARSEEAWSAVYRQYTTIVRRWLGTKMDPDEGVPAVFERFWRAVDREKFQGFTSLAAVLSYLKMCVYTTAIDNARVLGTRHEVQVLEAADARASSERVDDVVAEQLDGRALWRRIQELLQDDRASLALYLSYAVDLSPREICARRPDAFPDIQAVYQAKRNALDRLRRSGLFSAWQN